MLTGRLQSLLQTGYGCVLAELEQGELAECRN
jgi:hypothetical protein